MSEEAEKETVVKDKIERWAVVGSPLNGIIGNEDTFHIVGYFVGAEKWRITSPVISIESNLLTTENSAYELGDPGLAFQDVLLAYQDELGGKQDFSKALCEALQAKLRG